jgi:hypothetical protein
MRWWIVKATKFRPISTQILRIGDKQTDLTPYRELSQPEAWLELHVLHRGVIMSFDILLPNREIFTLRVLVSRDFMDMSA